MVRMLTTEMPENTVFPDRIVMPFSTFCSSNFRAGYPGPEEAFVRFNPALRVFHQAGRFHVRESGCSVLLHPFSNTENRQSVTNAVHYHMPFDIRRLRSGRMRRVMSSLANRTDVDLVQQDVTPEEFIRVSRPAIKRELFAEYFPFPGARKMYESPVVRDVLSFLGLAHLGNSPQRFVTRYTISAITRADGPLKYDSLHRPMVLVTEEGSWDREGKKPFLDAQFGVMEGGIGRRRFNKLFSIGAKPVFTEGKNDDTRDADWVLSWNRLVHGLLYPIEELDYEGRESLDRANNQARAYLHEGRLYPERRVQDGGVFAQNQAVGDAWYPIPTRRLSRDMLIEIRGEQIDEQTKPIHIPESIESRSVGERMEQFRRAARYSIYYGNALNHTEAGRAHLRDIGLAIDLETIRRIQNSVSPEAFRRHLLEMDPAQREAYLDAALADDIVSLHPVFDFIDTYRSLGLFKYYRVLSQVTDPEWDRIVEVMQREKKVGDRKTFNRKQYATMHADEYETIDDDGNLLPTYKFAQWDLMQKYVNPYALFIRAIGKANVASKDVREAIRSPRYLENLDRLLNMDPTRQ